MITEILLGLKPIPKSLIDGASKRASYKNLGAKDELRNHHTCKRIFLNKEVKNHLTEVIDSLVLSGMKNPDLIYYKMDEMGEIPKRNGVKLAMSTHKEYVHDSLRKLNMNARYSDTPMRIVELFDGGKTKEQIAEFLNVGIRHVHQSLVKHSRLKKRKTPNRIYQTKLMREKV